MRSLGTAALVSLGIVATGCGASVSEPDAPTQGAPVTPAQDAAPQHIGPAAAAAAPDQRSCPGNKEPIFTCKVPGGKQASICEVAAIDGRGFAQYRFGPVGGAAELIFPATAQGAQLSWASVAYSGGGEAQVSFAQGDTNYVIYSRVVRTNFVAGEPNDPEFSDGVMVLRGGRKLAQFACTGDVQPIDYNAAERLMVQADDLFTYERGE